jgi:beta-phosphoglucomutase
VSDHSRLETHKLCPVVSTAITTKPAAWLFDLDGVLVRTEELHCEAYRSACAARGLDLPWDFPRYCVAAHYGPERLQEELRRELPGLFSTDFGWEALYRDKSRRYLALLEAGDVELQPGTAAVLERLAAAGAPRAVATNSTREQTLLLRRRLPVLATVEHWVTREDYSGGKPAPDAYLEALRRLANPPPERCVGFEDTPRGLQALAGAGIPPVLVTRTVYPDLAGVVPRLTVPDLAALPAALLP